MYYFNPDSNTYTPITNLPTPCGGCVNFNMGETGYIGLGNNGYNNANVIYKYNAASNTWSQADSFGGGPRWTAFSQVVAGRPYIGCGSDSLGASNSLYDLWTWTCDTPTITQRGDTLFSSLTGSCQWYRNDTLIAGETSSFYIPLSNGSYTVQASDSNSCNSLSWVFPVMQLSVPGVSDQQLVRIYPSPATDAVTINVDARLLYKSYSFSDMTGRIILSGKIEKETSQFDISNIASGIYLLQIEGRSYKVVKE